MGLKMIHSGYYEYKATDNSRWMIRKDFIWSYKEEEFGKWWFATLIVYPDGRNYIPHCDWKVWEIKVRSLKKATEKIERSW